MSDGGGDGDGSDDDLSLFILARRPHVITLMHEVIGIR